MKRNYLSELLLVCLLFISSWWPSTVLAAHDAVENTTSTDISTNTTLPLGAKAALSFDGKTGKIFYEKNATTPLPIASTTKLLTMYLIFEAIHSGQLAWEDEITISEHLAALSRNMDLSNVILTEGESYSVKELFLATEKVSANAAVIALSEKIAGSEKDFVDLMRAKLQEWQINDAYIISTSGLNNEDTLGQIYPGSKDTDENLMSAKDLGIVAFHLLSDFPEILDYAKERTSVFANGTASQQSLLSTNEMLPDAPFYLEGVDGLKTGTTTLAGTCFVGTIERDGRRVVTVVLHSETMPERYEGQRFKDTKLLMQDALENWEEQVIYPSGNLKGDLKNYTVTNGLTSTVSLAVKQTTSAWVHNKTDKREEVALTMDPTLLTNKNALKAPIESGQKVGSLTITLNEDSRNFLLDDLESISVPVYATNTVEKAPWYTLIKVWLTQWFH